MRVFLIGLLGTLALALVAAARANLVVVEDWSEAEVGGRGVPPGWQNQN